MRPRYLLASAAILLIITLAIIKSKCLNSSNETDDLKLVFQDYSRRWDTWPLVTGDTFKLFSHFTYDEFDRSQDPSFISNNSIVFVNSDYLNDFFVDIFPKINTQFILITHNSDLSVPSKWLSYLNNNKLIHWLGINPDITYHEKFSSIPLGFINAKSSKEYTKLVQQQFKERSTVPWSKRRIKLYINFKYETNRKERKSLIDYYRAHFKQDSLIVTKRLSRGEYIDNLKNSKFVLCPPGTGLDTHRFYEALLYGAIPIVKNSTLLNFYLETSSIILNDLKDLTHKILNDINAYPLGEISLIKMERWLTFIYKVKK